MSSLQASVRTSPRKVRFACATMKADSSDKTISSFPEIVIMKGDLALIHLNPPEMSKECNFGNESTLCSKEEILNFAPGARMSNGGWSSLSSETSRCTSSVNSTRTLT